MTSCKCFGWTTCALSVAYNGRSSTIADRLGALVSKKKLGSYKNDRPLFRGKKKDFETVKAERYFFF